MSSKACSPPHNSKIFDQFKLAELFGGDFGKSSMGMLVLRNLLKHKQLGEGELSNRVGSRVYRPDWKPFIEALEKAGYVAFEFTGKGAARSVSLTEKAVEYLTENHIEPEQETETKPTE
jgi:hypothetical protein